MLRELLLSPLGTAADCIPSLAGSSRWALHQHQPAQGRDNARPATNRYVSAQQLSLDGGVPATAWARADLAVAGAV